MESANIRRTPVSVINTDFSRPPDIIAEQILWLRREIETTPMHVLKLAYFSHGWMLGLHDQTLIHEPVEAWQYGPVIPSVFHRYKAFRGDPIDLVPIDRSEQLSVDQQDIVRDVVAVYWEARAIELSNISHNSGSPWDIVMHSHGPDTIIPNRLIQKHYKRLTAT